ncbi:hypothetical protein [Rhodococcoides fascians]|uniref:hypothetical protein n=1 Tax=Rhodococcoides fascians TaxID=1828 RepID=UPI000564BF90|nr:hypothetical protein [Rhodococcus fascians]
MTTATTTYLRPIAVVDEPAGKICIWHVDVGPDIGLSRLSGAWVLDADNTHSIQSLIKNRYIVRCGGTDVVERHNIVTAKTVDVDATFKAVLAERDSLQERFDRYAATRRTLVAPSWPDIVHPAEIATTVRRTQEVAAKTGNAFPLARGLNELALAWTQIEKQRIARPFLIDPAGPATRPLPLELYDNDERPATEAPLK